MSLRQYSPTQKKAIYCIQREVTFPNLLVFVLVKELDIVVIAVLKTRDKRRLNEVH